MLLQKQITQPLFEPVDQFQHRAFREIGAESNGLLRSEIVPVTAHEREQTSILRADAIQIAPAVQEVMVHQPDHMKTISALGKCLRTSARYTDARSMHTTRTELLPSKA